MKTLGWLMDEAERAQLLARFPPRYADVVAHHVTLRPDPPADVGLPSADHGRIVGHVDDGRGIEALIIEVDGGTTRPDGGTYHITWSLDRSAGRKPVHSNDAIAKLGWESCEPVAIRLIPALF